MRLIIKHLKIINKKNVGQILYDYIKEVGIYENLLANSEDLKAKNISKFFEKIKEFENNSKDISVMAFVDYIDLLIEVGESPNVTDGDWQENNAVNILTVHSSKGLEFPIVFLVNLVSERFPSRERHEQIPIPNELIKETLPKGDFHLQEERRLFYVGMTRAKERLFLTGAKYYGDGKREKKISPFVMEAIRKNAIWKNQDFKTRDITINHKPYSIRPLKLEYLSVSQIETFETCPMHYKLRYLIKIPTESSASLSFGVSIHNTMKEYFSTKGDILEIFKKNWIEDGFQNKKHKHEFYKKGEKYLTEYLEKNITKNIVPKHLEEKFTMQLDKTLKIGGTIDRIDELSDGTIEIIDYKTGANIPTQKEVDKDLQLSFYCIAVAKMLDKKVEDIKLSLYYFENQEKITTLRTEEQLEEVRQKIFEIRKKIEESDFKCNNSFFCQGKCEYSMFCKTN